jgi:quinoprotein glucose dehydrogenase
VHHDLWDFDFRPHPCGYIPSARQSKRSYSDQAGFLFVLDRATGTPVWPIEERPVPKSTVAGEVTSPTQPVPTKPPPYEHQSLLTDDLIDFTPELRAEHRAVKQQDRSLFTRPR